MTRDELGDLAEATVPAATDLICRVREGDAEGITRLADANGWDTQTAALIVVLAAMVPDTAPVGDLLAWTDTVDVIVKWRQQPLLLPAPGRPVEQPCGTYAAARRHQRAGEAIDPACREALRQYQVDRRRAAKEAAA